MEPPRIRAFAARAASPHSKDSIFHGWTDPSPLVTGDAERRRARLLAGLLIVFTPIGLVASVVSAAMAGVHPLTDPVTLNGMLASLSGAGLYFVARTRHVHYAAVGTVGAALYGGWATTLAAAGAPEAAAAPFFVTISIIVASALLPLRYVVGTAVVNMAGIVAVPHLVPGMGYYDALTVSIFVFMLSGFLIVFTIVRGRDLAQIEEQTHDLEAKEAGLQAIMESTPDRVFVVDRDGGVRQTNNSAAGADEPAVGARVLDHVQGDTGARVAEALQAAFRDRATTTVEAEGTGAFAQCAWVQHVVAPIRHEEQVLAALWIVRDRTDEHQAEQGRLERVARDAEMARLEEMSAFKAQFLNMAAHEICTPLTPIKLSVRALAHPKLDEAHRKTVIRRIERGVDRMHALLTGFLDAARLDAGRLAMTPQHIDLGVLADELVDGYEQMAAERGVRIVPEIERPLAVHADPGRLMQVLTNLVDNALKYGNGQEEIRVVAYAGDGHANIEVRDQGRGFPAEAADELFQPFNRLAERVDARTEGTGLGLYISRGIIEQHGGRMWGRSEGPGKGATFGFSLPLVVDGAKSEAHSIGSDARATHPRTEP